jgi:hypothetical protein
MLRSKTYWFVLALLATAGATGACTRADATGPSQEQGPSFDKNDGNH